MAAMAVLLALPAVAQSGQNSPPAPQKASQPTKKDQGKKEKDKKDQAQTSAAEQNAFPEAKSEKAAQQAKEPPSSQSAPSAPQPHAQPKGNSAAAQNPFPEEKSEQAAKQVQQGQQTQPGQKSQPGQDSDSSSSRIKGLKLPNAGPDTGQGLEPELSPSLGKKDTKVGNFYLQSGDYKGAYSRFLEATRVDPGDAEAVYGLAESARHLGNKKVAIQNFQLYLSALPHGPRAKDCRRQLKEMGVRR